MGSLVSRPSTPTPPPPPKLPDPPKEPPKPADKDVLQTGERERRRAARSSDFQNDILQADSDLGPLNTGKTSLGG